MAQRAADKTNQATINEQQDLQNVADKIPGYVNGGGTTPGEPSTPGGDTPGDDKPAMPAGWDKEKVTAEKSKDDVVVPVGYLTAR